MSYDIGRKLLREGIEVLAIPVSVSRNEFVLTKLSGLRNIPGFIVRDGEIREWRIEGFFKHENRLYLQGPYLEGSFLEEVTGKSFAAVLPYLIRLVNGLLALKRQGLSIESLQTDSVYFLERGGVLFLPPAMMAELRNMHPEEHKLQVFESINHPDFEDPETRISYSLAALLYRAILGQYPFRGENEVEIHNRARHEKLLPLSLLEPGLREELSDRILSGLGRGDQPPPSIEEWSETLQSCKQEGLYRDITELERESLRRQARKEQNRIVKAYGKKVFWQKHWKTVVIVSAVVVVVGALAGSFLKNILAPRATRGFTPLQVVEAFYQSINSLDHALMEDCVVEGAGKQTIREVMNIYVMSRVSLGYEGRSNIVPADAWDEQGRPPLESRQSVYGVTGLRIVQEAGQPEPVFRVLYSKWFPEPEAEEPGGSGRQTEESSAGPRIRHIEIEERVYLKQDKRDWVIYRFERLNPL